MASPEPNPGDEAPYIPASQSLPEITVKAAVVGVLLSIILAGANAYLGLKVGMTVSASIPAAVISMAVLRLFRQSNILENNIVQTAASAGESLAAGVIFTLPALIMLSYWDDFEFIPTTAIALSGGILGVLFTVPLRRALIVQSDLRFPEGVATGEVLKAGERRGQGARQIAVAAIAGATVKLVQTGLKLASSSVHGSLQVGRVVFGFGTELGVALLAVGYIVGLNIAVLVLSGGLISWALAIPIYMTLASSEELTSIIGDATGYDAALALWSARVRYLGVGAMATGGIWALASLLKPIREGIRASIAAVREARSGRDPHVPRTERDAPIHFVLGGAAALAVPIFVIFVFIVDRESLGISRGLHTGTLFFGVGFSLLAGFLFSSVAGYMAGLVGSSNNPISGVTIATILAASLILLWLLGMEIDFRVDTDKAVSASATAILIGAVVCCAAAIAGDNMQDLKAGRIVGATPYKQQIMQILGVTAAALTIAPVLQLLFHAYGLGDVLPRADMTPAEALKAPQATLMSSVAAGVFSRNLPWQVILIGAGVAAGIIALDKGLERRGSGFRTPVLAVAVGLYLPLELSVPIFLGGLVAHVASRHVQKRGGAMDEAAGHGLLFASGLITGEALVGILLAVPFAAFQSTDVLAVALPAGYAPVADAVGLFGLAFVALWLYRVAVRS